MQRGLCPDAKNSLVFKKTAVNLECATHKSYSKLISWVAVQELEGYHFSMLDN